MKYPGRVVLECCCVTSPHSEEVRAVRRHNQASHDWVQTVKYGIAPDSSIYPRMQSFTVPSGSSGTIKFPVRDGCRPTLEERDGRTFPHIPLTERLPEDRLDSWRKIADDLSR